MQAAAAVAIDEMAPVRTAGTLVYEGQLFRRRAGRRVAFDETPPPPAPEPVVRPARVARMLALAHRLEAGIDAGEYADRADVARHLGVSRARVTQLLDLALLAPEIQEAILEMVAVDGREPLAERELRPIVRCPVWELQRRTWRSSVGPTPKAPAVRTSCPGPSRPITPEKQAGARCPHPTEPRVSAP